MTIPMERVLSTYRDPRRYRDVNKARQVLVCAQHAEPVQRERLGREGLELDFGEAAVGLFAPA